jgi:acid phosphatase
MWFIWNFTEVALVRRSFLILCTVFVVAFSLTGAAQSTSQATHTPQATQSSQAVHISVPTENVANLGTLKLKLQRYYACTCDCGCYQKELDHQAQVAIDFLDRRAAHKKPAEKLALVLDIDETALSNYKEMAAQDYGYVPSAFDAWEDSAQATAIPGTLRLYQEAQRLGVSVFFITGRGEAHRGATEQNLKNVGYTTWEGLTLRTAAQAKEATIAYKSGARKAIVDAGYRIILNVGDQFSDLKGSPTAEFSVKLPNPFYYLP